MRIEVRECGVCGTGFVGDDYIFTWTAYDDEGNRIGSEAYCVHTGGDYTPEMFDKIKAHLIVKAEAKLKSKWP